MPSNSYPFESGKGKGEGGVGAVFSLHLYLLPPRDRGRSEREN